MDRVISIFEQIGQIAYAVPMRIVTDETVPYVLLFALFVLAVSLLRSGFRFSWPKRLVEGVFANLAILAINALLVPAAFLLSDSVRQGYAALSIPHIDTSFWQQVPVWILIPFAVFCFDFVDYWAHRLMHSTKVLWPIHAIHHSDPDVTALTTYRVHFFEPIVVRTFYIVFLSWLGFPAQVIGFGAIFLAVLNAYVHVNVDWHHGPLRYVIVSPRFHRWHHADCPEAHGKNLANVFPIFDVLFGTYYVPGPCKVEMGAGDVPQNDVAKLILYPFAQWYQLAAESTASTIRSIRKLGQTG